VSQPPTPIRFEQLQEVLLAEPRGFCAGVERAIEIVERALERFGAPIYVRHEIVHNDHVVSDLRSKGAIFVEDLDEVPIGARVIMSAHGVSRAVRDHASGRNLEVFDATCPLVTKVHVEVRKLRAEGYEIVMIGHAGHPEVEGTMGQIDEGMYLVEDLAGVASLRENTRPACLCEPDDTFCGRHCDYCSSLGKKISVDSWAEKKRYLLRHTESSGCSQGDG